MVDWGNVPAYFGGLALVLTLTVVQRDRREKVRDQANKVAAWVQRSRTENEPHRILIKNASDLPCTSLLIWSTVGYRNPSALRLSKTFGEDTDRGGKKPDYEHAVGPGETIVLLETSEDCAVRGLEFVDAAGRRWSRYGSQLVRLDTIAGRVFRRTRMTFWRIVIRLRRTWS
ncbi:hypothetical protein AB0C38_27860 [Amycolatopsis sp. NPDC048633]|uniref:hypothetical protein n=1 Tax=Amycolatopsis sp. NPDC048633 TaxID=3157095 RepID=UPI0033D223B7